MLEGATNELHLDPLQEGLVMATRCGDIDPAGDCLPLSHSLQLFILSDAPVRHLKADDFLSQAPHGRSTAIVC